MTRMPLSLIAMGLVGIGCGGSTSGDSGGAACDPSTACGGDLAGIWNVTSICLSTTGAPTDSSLPPECQDGYRRALASTIATPTNLKVTFDTTGSYQMSGSITQVLTWPMSSACFLTLSGGTPLSQSLCTQWGDATQSQLDSTHTARCTYAGGVCTCTLTQTTTPSGGTYTTSGSTMTWDGKTTPNPYCVTGSSATVEDADTHGGGEIIQRAKLQR